MGDEEEILNKYLNLPDDPEMAFAQLQQREYSTLEQIWADDSDRGWYYERRYVDTLIAFDEVHDLGILTAYRNPPTGTNDFAEFFQDFRRQAEVASQKIMIEAARRLKTGAQEVVVLEAPARDAIHKLIGAIREKLNELSLPEGKREALFNKLNAFAAEVDRNRTRTEAFLAFVVELGRAGKDVGEALKPIQETIDRVLDFVEKAKKLRDALPPWAERRKVEGPRKRLPSPEQELDDDIPF